MKKNILSHPVTSKQPHKIVQILMRHPVLGQEVGPISMGHTVYQLMRRLRNGL